jgi:sulfane dehydrogenase subunit SoxC
VGKPLDQAIEGTQMTEEEKSDRQWCPVQEMDPDTTYRFRVAADELVAEITPNSDIFVLAHFGVPRIERSNWRLHISGMIDRPAVLTFEDILRFRKFKIQSFLNCAGFPANPKIATRNVSNAVWAGADLAEVLDSVGVHANASFIWSYGPDHGVYQNWAADCYVKDLPIERIRSGKVLLAYEVNGEPLSHAHGYPLRLFIPGFYGTNSVKWLSRIEASNRRAPGIFTTELYNDPVPSDSTEPARRTAPVWEVPPEALIVSPAANARISAGPIHVSGWSWGACQIEFVEISMDEGRIWHRVEAGPRVQNSWQRFDFVWKQETPGKFSVMARATDLDGKTQPDADARNAVHKIRIQVL